ncbi:charged multivesicular body protein 2b-like [Corticium candelabrum]|uniref:charged multivesicular body protein 2b-like n=1 Tax=Corticium candelabrum TaxID=121492 RepID=UPI002E261A6E|nr:charged multivesicular body protein 2b-like [Corticium candelabrum]
MSRDPVRQQKRELKKTERDLERDRRALERQEKQLEAEIKKAAKQGNKQLATSLAKQLIGVRKQKTRSMGISTKVKSIGAQTTAMHSNVKLAHAMANTTRTMTAMNAQISPQAMQQTLQQFEMESSKMEMTEEMMDDTLSSVLDESGDEEESEAIMNQVLDEIGIEITGKVAAAPRAHASALPSEGVKAKTRTRAPEDDLAEQLARLKDL